MLSKSENYTYSKIIKIIKITKLQLHLEINMEVLS